MEKCLPPACLQTYHDYIRQGSIFDLNKRNSQTFVTKLLYITTNILVGNRENKRTFDSQAHLKLKMSILGPNLV